MVLFRWLDMLPWNIAALLLVTIFVLFTVAGLFLIRRKKNWKHFKEHHDVAGFVFGNLGMLYGVVLGFTVVSVQQRFDKIQQNTEIEAGLLIELHADAEVFPEKNRQEICAAIKNYAQSIVHIEWPLMVKGLATPEATPAIRKLWQAYYALKPSDSREEVWYTQSVANLNQLTSIRLARLSSSKESLGAEMWLLLILGAIIMVTFLWFFGLDSVTTHVLLSIVLASSVAFLLYLIYTLDAAFSGEVNVPPDVFLNAIKSF